MTAGPGTSRVDPSVAIIGGGFAGIAAAVKLTRAGLTAGAATDEEDNTVLIGAKPHP